MKKSLMILALVAGCGAADHDGNRSAPQAKGGGRSPGSSAPAGAAQSAAASGPGGLSGLWEGGAQGQPNQLCMAAKGDSTQFGITVWGANLASCSGAGIAERDGARLTLTMTGDSPCAIQGRIEGGRIVLPAEVPQGCAYYCGQRARFGGAAFTLRQAGAAAAGRAKDLGGDPLCG